MHKRGGARARAVAQRPSICTCSLFWVVTVWLLALLQDGADLARLDERLVRLPSHPVFWCFSAAPCPLHSGGLIRGSLAVVRTRHGKLAVPIERPFRAGRRAAHASNPGWLEDSRSPRRLHPRHPAALEHRTNIPAHLGLGWAVAGFGVCSYGIGFWLQGTYAVPQLGPMVPGPGRRTSLGFLVLLLLGITNPAELRRP